MEYGFRRFLVYFAVSFAIGCLMISSESLWIDEALTARYAQKALLVDWARQLAKDRISEVLMPLSMWFAWAGGRLLGTGEWQLRALNLLWVGLGGAAMGLLGKGLRIPACLPLFLVNPFLWFYANEARPYALLICAGAWLLFSLVSFQVKAQPLTRDIWIFCLATVVGFAASLLFSFLLLGVGAAVVCLAWQRRDRLKFSGRQWLPLGLTAILLLLLGAYYIWTLSRWAGRTRLWNVSPLNLVFAIYELLGFSGLGPPRIVLRELVRVPTQLLMALAQPRFVFGLGGLAVVCLLLSVRAWKLRSDPLVRLLLLPILFSSVALYLTCTVTHSTFWGRHLAPLIAFVVLLIGQLTSAASSGIAPPRNQVLLIILLVCWTASAILLRFHQDYRKDDYRSATALAVTLLDSGKVVWWSADPTTAEYYGLRFRKKPAVDSRLFLCAWKTHDELRELPSPDAIFVSKPDVFDRSGFLQSRVQVMNYRRYREFPAFSVWVRPGLEKEQLLE